LPTAARDGILSTPEELIGQLAIREAMAEVISRSAVAIADTAAFVMVVLRYSGPKPIA